MKNIQGDAGQEHSSGVDMLSLVSPEQGLVGRGQMRELALEIASANGVLRVALVQGKDYTQIESDYQASVNRFDAALNQLYASYKCSKCEDCLFDESVEFQRLEIGIAAHNKPAQEMGTQKVG